MLKSYKEKLIAHFAPYSNPKFVLLVALAYISYRISMESQLYADILATQHANNSITDTLFTLLPTYNTKIIHGDLAFYYASLRDMLLFLFPQRILFALFSLSLLILTRVFFVNLTHLGIPEGSNPIEAASTFGGDLFFSGHTAYPILIAFIFWDIKILRYTFLGIGILLGVSSIVGRYHYSIDVVSAPFIAYGVFKISEKIFKK